MKNATNEIVIDPHQNPSRNYNELVYRSLKWISNSPGFFTPYTSGGDFFLALTNPISRPLIGAFLTGIFSILAAAASIVALGCLIVYSGAIFYKKNELSARCFDLITLSVTAALILGLATLVAAVKTIQAIITDPVKLLTRTTSSIMSSLITISTDIENETLKNAIPTL